MGMIYKRGKVFWIKYYSGGKPIRESAGTMKNTEAQRKLKEKEGRSASGLQPFPAWIASLMTNWLAICVCIMRRRARAA